MKTEEVEAVGRLKRERLKPGNRTSDERTQETTESPGSWSIKRLPLMKLRWLEQAVH